MANELQIVAQGDGLTSYAVVRRVSDAFVWSVTNTAWEAWDDANIDDYDIALSNQGGDWYVGDFPTDIDAPVKVRVNYYDQDGGTATITDVLLKSIEHHWNGTSLTAGGGAVGAADCVLVDLDTVKRHMTITDNSKDDLLQQIINQQSSRVNAFLGRSLCADNYVEFHPVREDCTIVTHNLPILYVNRISYDRCEALRLRFTGGTRAMASVTGDGVRLLTTDNAGVDIETVIEFATYPTIAMVATAIDGLAGWEATTNTVGLASNLYRAASKSALDNWVCLDWPEDDCEDYHIDPLSGIVKILDIRFNAREVLVEYRAGYDPVPEAVQGVMVELVSSAMARTGDTSAGPTPAQIASESIGDYSYSKGGDMGQSRSSEQQWLTGSQQAALAPYMLHRVGVSL